MAQTIKLKRSATAGKIPTTSSLELGEVAINTYDGKMYMKKNVGGTESVVEVTSSQIPSDPTFDSITLTGAPGPIEWNSDEDTVDVPLNSDVTLQLGQESVFRGKAVEAILNGDAVMFAGAQGDHLLIAKADASADGFSPEFVIGIATQDFALNEYGFVTTFGKVRGLNTTSYTEGDILYFDPTTAGGLTTTKPTAPAHIIQMCAVVRSHITEGTLLVRPTHMVDTDEVPEGSSNLYFTDQRVFDAADSRYVNTTGDTMTGTLNVNSTINAQRLRLSASNDASLSSTLHAFEIGSPAGQNLVIDNNEIHSRNNGAISTLFLNGDGGEVKVNGNLSTYTSILNGSVVTSTKVSAPILEATGNTIKFANLNDSITYNESLNKFSFNADGGTDNAIISAGGAEFSTRVSIVGDNDTLALQSTSDGTIPVGISFTSQGASATQVGHIRYTHRDIYSYGGNESFTIGGTETNTVILADGQFYYKDGIYKKPASGTGVGTRKDLNWDAAYSWGDHSQEGYLVTETDTLATVAARGNSTSNTLIVTSIDGGNPSAATDNARLSGYGVLGNRSTFYFTNPGTVQIGVGNSHNADPAMSFQPLLNTSHKPLNVAGNLNVSGTITGNINYSNITNPPTIDNSVDYINSASFNTSTGVLTLDGVGRAGATVDLDGRYYNTTDSDNRYVNITGDTMTGRLVLPDSGYSIGNEYHTWKRSYAVSNTSPAELLDYDGTALEAGGVYRFHAHINATGTDQSATAVFWNQNGVWKVNVTYQSGTGSNNPEFIIGGSPEVPQIHIDHSSTYSIQVLGERLELSEGTGTDNKSGFGTDAFLGSVNGILRYNDGGSGNTYAQGDIVWHEGNVNPVTGLTHDTVNTELDVAFADGTTQSLDLTQYIDDTNLSRVVSGSHVGSGIVRFVREDATTFDVDFSDFFDDTNLARITSASWNTTNGVLSLIRNDATTVNVDLDNRYLQSYTETDTLQSVTARGNTSTNDINVTEGADLTLRAGGNEDIGDIIWKYNNNTEKHRLFDGGTGLNYRYNAGTSYKIWHDGYHPVAWEDITNPPTIDNSVDYINGASFNTSTGVLSLTGVGRAGATVDLDGRYYNTTDSDSRYVRKTGDTMTGTLSFSNSVQRDKIDLNGSDAHCLGWESYYNTYGPNTWNSGFIGHKFFANAGTLIANIGTGGSTAAGSTESAFYGKVTAPQFSGKITTTGNGNTNAPFVLSDDYNSWLIKATPTSNWGLFWAGNTGAAFGTNTVAGVGNIWSNSSNPNEFCFVSSLGTQWSLYGNDGRTWQNGEARAPTFRSMASTGTAPLTVSSTTVVSNLNADLLDGQHGSYYLDYNNITNPPTIPDTSIYVRKSGDTMTGNLTTGVGLYFGTSTSYNYKPYVTGGIGTRSEMLSAANILLHADTDGSGTAEFVSIRAGAGTANELKLLSKTSGAGQNNQALTLNGNKVFNDAYHPNADKWTTAVTNTVTLTGDVSGTGSASVDGSGNWTVSVPTVVANNSHTHDDRYVKKTGDTMSGLLIAENGIRIGTGNHFQTGEAALTFGEGNPTGDSMYITYDGENASGDNNNISIGSNKAGVGDLLHVTYGGKVGIGAFPESNTKLHVRKASAGTRYIDNYSTAVIEDTEARLQLVSSNSGTNAAAVVLSNQNHHWSMHHRGTTSGNYLSLGYADTTSVTDIVDSTMTGQKLNIYKDGNLKMGYGSGQNYLMIGDQVTDNNTGGWNKGVHLNANAHGRFRIRTTASTYGPLESYFWADATVSPSMGIYGNKSTFKFTGSITTLQNKDGATYWHSGSFNPANYIAKGENVDTTLGNSTDNRAAVMTFNHSHTNTFAANTDIGDSNRVVTIQNPTSTTTNGIYTALHMQVSPGVTASRAMGDIKFVRNNGMQGKWVFTSKNTSGSPIDAISIQDDITKISGGLEIEGNLSRGTYTSLSQYHTGADNIVLKGNSVGISGIFFESEKNGTNINHPSDFGFIQYHAYGTSTSGESNELIIGVSNDADDHVIVNAPNVNGFKFRTGVSATDYTVWHAGNFNPSNYLTSYTETDTLQTVCGRGNTTNTNITSTSNSIIVNTGSYANFIADGGTNQWKYLSLRTNGATKWDIATKDDDLAGALQFRVAGGSGTRMTLDTSGNLIVPGLLTATQKSFTIDHPTKEGHKLRYGSLEGPENGVYVRGRLKDNNTIELPEYWKELVHEDSITVSLTAIGKSQEIWVEDFNTEQVIVGGESVNCFYTVYGERKDVDKLVTEFKEVQ